MNRLFAAGLLALFASASVADPIVMDRPVPYGEDADVPNKVRNECVKLQEQLADFTQEFGREFGVDVTFGDTNVSEGRVLKVEILQAISSGNAFLGHHKSTYVRGALFENGEEVADFRARRNSMGGAFAGYKGSCSVLGRTVKALGKDIAMWLKNPSAGAQLGD